MIVVSILTVAAMMLVIMCLRLSPPGVELTLKRRVFGVVIFAELVATSKNNDPLVFSSTCWRREGLVWFRIKEHRIFVDC